MYGISSPLLNNRKAQELEPKKYLPQLAFLPGLYILNHLVHQGPLPYPKLWWSVSHCCQEQLARCLVQNPFQSKTGYIMKALMNNHIHVYCDLHKILPLLLSKTVSHLVVIRLCMNVIYRKITRFMNINIQNVDKKERRFGVILMPFSSSNCLLINCQKWFSGWWLAYMKIINKSHAKSFAWIESD